MARHSVLGAEGIRLNAPLPYIEELQRLLLSTTALTAHKTRPWWQGPGRSIPLAKQLMGRRAMRATARAGRAMAAVANHSPAARADQQLFAIGHTDDAAHHAD